MTAESCGHKWERQLNRRKRENVIAEVVLTLAAVGWSSADPAPGLSCTIQLEPAQVCNQTCSSAASVFLEHAFTCMRPHASAHLKHRWGETLPCWNQRNSFSRDHLVGLKVWRLILSEGLNVQNRTRLEPINLLRFLLTGRFGLISVVILIVSNCDVSLLCVSTWNVCSV